MDSKLELAQLMARFKLKVRRSLNQSVDLGRLAQEPNYARIRLMEIEDAATDEELLVMVIRLREWLIPPKLVDQPVEKKDEKKAEKPARTRDYLLGAR